MLAGVGFCDEGGGVGLTKWLANSKPGVLADAYSKSMTTNCLCSFAGRSNGDSDLGSRRRRLPYCVCDISTCPI